MATPTALAPADRSIGARQDLGVLLAVAVAVRLPALLASAHTTFDDGVFGASAVAMRAGGVPFRDVFSSQGPLFLPLVWLGDAVGFRTADSPRLVSLVAGLALVTVTYLAGRTVADRTGARLAAALVAGCASILWVTGPLAADGVALAFATGTVALLLRWRDDLTVRRAVWLGLGLSGAISVKALLAPVIVPVALALLAGRRLLPIVAGAVTAIGTHLLLWLPWGPGDVWDQAYGYHLDVAGRRTPGANLAKLLSTLGDRDLPLLVALALALVAVVLARRGRSATSPALALQARLTDPSTLLGAWLGATLLVLLTEHPMWRPHVSQVVPPLALLAARHRPPARWLAVAAVLVLPYHLVRAWPVLHPDGYRAVEQQVEDGLRGLPPGARAISDDPGIVWRAGRLTPPDLVDASILRMQTGDLTPETITAAAAADGVCAVAVLRAEAWGSFPDLPARLEAAGYRVAVRGTGVERLYLRDC